MIFVIFFINFVSLIIYFLYNCSIIVSKLFKNIDIYVSDPFQKQDKFTVLMIPLSQPCKYDICMLNFIPTFNGINFTETVVIAGPAETVVAPGLPVASAIAISHV